MASIGLIPKKIAIVKNNSYGTDKSLVNGNANSGRSVFDTFDNVEFTSLKINSTTEFLRTSGFQVTCNIGSKEVHCSVPLEVACDILDNCTIKKGSVIGQKWIIVTLGAQGYPIRVGSDIHKDIVNAAGYHATKTVGLRSLKPGTIYSRKDGTAYLFLGRVLSEYKDWNRGYSGYGESDYTHEKDRKSCLWFNMGWVGKYSWRNKSIMSDEVKKFDVDEMFHEIFFDHILDSEPYCPPFQKFDIKLSNSVRFVEKEGEIDFPHIVAQMRRFIHSPACKRMVKSNYEAIYREPYHYHRDPSSDAQKAKDRASSINEQTNRMIDNAKRMWDGLVPLNSKGKEVEVPTLD
jgi:hypothetical protein